MLCQLNPLANCDPKSMRVHARHHRSMNVPRVAEHVRFAGLFPHFAGFHGGTVHTLKGRPVRKKTSQTQVHPAAIVSKCLILELTQIQT